ncbi:VOC family protein [Chloroflexota bacterium]
MPSYTFDHVHLMSTDPVKTAEFYEKTFAARRISASEMPGGRVNVSLDLNGVTILISQARDDTVQNGLGHFGIRTDDLEAAVKELKASGVKFNQEITEIRPDFKISFVAAPENVTIELQQGSL